MPDRVAMAGESSKGVPLDNVFRNENNNIAWTFEFTKKAQKQWDKLDSKAQSRIKKAVIERLVINPQTHLIPLRGDKVGDYRLALVGICFVLASGYFIRPSFQVKPPVLQALHVLCC